jgi:molybdenum cofactor sulfurtransferase
MSASAVATRRTYPSDQMESVYQEFIKRYPDYQTTAHLDVLRAKEYSRLDDLGHVYLDYTGGGLYADSQLEKHQEILRRGVFGNPHSSNPTSQASTHLDEDARAFVLEYFNADPEEYVVIFTANASGALKLVGESYPFQPGGHYLLTFDNHNSVNGIREFARAHGAQFTYVPVVPPDLRIHETRLRELLDTIDPAYPHLFAYPAQSNFSGVKHSLEWIADAQAKGWDVLVDAAAFAPTNRLNLGEVHPDFVTLSFYKMFGYPTGVGALIARKAVLEKLRRPWFAGGTITIASVQGDGHYLAEDEAGFEDGTINYLNLPAVEIGLRHLQAVGIEAINTRVRCLSGWLIEQLMALHHRNGQPLIALYGPANTDMRGGTVTINFFDQQGAIIPYLKVEALANEQKISLRTGCFCNPGADEIAHGLTEADLAECFRKEERMTFEQFITAMSGKNIEAVGAVRVSLGLVTNFADVYRFMNFAASFLDQ